MASAAVAGLLAFGAVVPAQADDNSTPQPDNSYSHQSTHTAAAGVGAFVTGGDNVHFSHTVAGAVNAHGWWKRLSGPATKAKVTVDLQVKSGAGWRTLKTGTKTVYSGGGSGKRAPAAWKCTNLIQKNSFRSVVDVDLVGYPDDSNKKITDTQTLYCGT
ncbi:hypothetical protein PV367_20645 [Streptomyces europaeiscabiei]|uniref:Secreted protein n=1 Tax=Streptomyces europaeiscabiei TaxID=146819 RepID=A0AAJ2PR61_9ACTN|nr:hypothetical protein [Streptomyces europaeiscabiei]MDX3132147.1 hypothetical protein [Streptomyces europaeiscabiei]